MADAKNDDTPRSTAAAGNRRRTTAEDHTHDWEPIDPPVINTDGTFWNVRCRDCGIEVWQG